MRQARPQQRQQPHHDERQSGQNRCHGMPHTGIGLHCIQYRADGRQERPQVEPDQHQQHEATESRGQRSSRRSHKGRRLS
jgi:hypothetical protein